MILQKIKSLIYLFMFVIMILVIENLFQLVKQETIDVTAKHVETKLGVYINEN